MVIGDGCLSINKGNRNAYFQMSHGGKQYEYLMWKKQILEQVTKCSVSKGQKSGFGKITDGCHLSSRVNPLYTKLHERFYLYYGRKSIDMYLLKRITPLALAIIYMDDGCCGRGDPKYWTKDTFYLCLCNFDYANLFLIKKSLKIKYDLDWNIIKQSMKPNSKRRYHNLRLLNKHNQRFVDIIKPYVEQVPSMTYKLGSYANTS